MNTDGLRLFRRIFTTDSPTEQQSPNKSAEHYHNQIPNCSPIMGQIADACAKQRAEHDRFLQRRGATGKFPRVRI